MNENIEGASEQEQGKVETHVESTNKSLGLEESLGNTIKESDLTDLSKEIGEVAIDSILEDGLLKELPIINTITGLIKFGIGVKERLFTKKVLKFLIELKDLDSKSREEFISKIDNDPKYRDKIGETIILHLERMDDFQKPSMLGRLFKACIEGHFNYEDFLRLASIINRAFTPDILSLKKLSDGDTLSSIQLENLSNYGLLSVDIIEKKTRRRNVMGMIREEKQSPEIKYKINMIGQLFIDYACE